MGRNFARLLDELDERWIKVGRYLRRYEAMLQPKKILCKLQEETISLASLTSKSYQAEMEVIQLPGLVQVDCRSLRSVKECCQDDCFIHFQFGVQVNTVVIPYGGLQSAKEQVINFNRRLARFGLHTPTVEKVPVISIGDADARLLTTVGVQQHSREHGTEQGGGQYAALLHSVGHCECFGYRCQLRVPSSRHEADAPCA
ncbi:unnamed protein product [Schistocephalus solidus]|uniref:KH_dom_type_1 domain-containing protein n=1 Tax=Schistocephalus solidus TaxID=70667 RepID=A0A183T1C7_SCHSO|nr:unnamed protein product [Schistocephalus solidus]